MTRLATVTTTRERALLELGGPPLDALRRALGRAGYESAQFHGQASGGTSTCYYLRTPKGDRLIFKRPLPGEDVAHEFALLRQAEAAAKRLPMQLPQPIVELEGGNGYVMGRISGTPLRQSLAAASPAPIAETADLLMDAITAWHTVIGQPYGDFHAANVMVTPGGELAFIDPGESTDVTRACRAWPPATSEVVDLGLWLHNCALDAPAAWVREPRGARAMLALAIELVARAARRHPEPRLFVRAVFDRAALHGGRLWRDPWLARRARSPFVQLALLELRHASLRTNL